MAVAFALATFAVVGAARADGAAPNDVAPPATTWRDVKSDVPIVAYAYGGGGARAGAMGAQLTGLGLAGGGQRAIAGGGATVWGAPIDRLTLVGDAQRNVFGNFAPSAAAILRLYGNPDDGLSLGALGKFKVDGFAGGPTRDEVESEVELGLLASYARAGWHLDLNAIAGRATGDDGETDAETRLRVGKDLGAWVRVGLDGQARLRLAGPKYLPNHQTWDFAAGPQIVIGKQRFYGALTTGPATMGLIGPGVGYTAVASFGGTL